MWSGVDIQYFWEGEEPYMGGLYGGILWGDLINPWKPCYIILPLELYDWLFILSQ